MQAEPFPSCCDNPIMQANMADQWTWWRAACAGDIGAMRESYPESGFYRHYTDAAVAIWRDASGVMSMLLNGEEVEDAIKAGKIWLQVAKHPVAKKDYDARISNGAWPSALPPLPTPAKTTEETAPAVEQEVAARRAGDNSKDLDTYQRMRAEVLGDVAEAEAWQSRTQITEKSIADKAMDWGNRLIRSAREADKARLEENAPLRRQIEENDAKWNAITNAAKARGSALCAASEAWGKAEVDRIRREQAEAARKKWEEEQAEAKRKRDAAAAEERQRRATMKADDDGVIHDDPVPEPDELPLAPPPPPPVAPEPKLMLGTGQNGNRRSVKTAMPETATIVDIEAAAAFYAKQKHPEIVELVQKLANRAIKARAEIPGIRFSWQSAKTEAAE